ncbi:type I glyceraldehyde-3-phosphate dehydrogenase [Patescibacteria group bacterium]
MKKIKISINGFGRIGRAFFREVQKNENIEVVAINDLGQLDNLAYLLKYDSVYKQNNSEISIKTGDKNILVVDGKEILFLNEKDPVNLPWKDLEVDVVVESTGVFTTYDKSQVHIEAGAKRVVISAPVKTKSDLINGETILVGINEEKLKTCQISSNASCTTNAGSPVLEILRQTIGIEKAMLNTVHGYTASQNLVDSTHKKDFRRGRAAAQNIVPSTTGAAIATTKAITELEGLFDGIATRVPVVSGSIVDITFIAKKDTTVEEVNQILKDASIKEQWKNIFTVTEEPIVSSDILGNPHASVVDLSLTRVVGGNLVKILSWYDNEVGYVNTLIRHVISASENI